MDNVRIYGKPPYSVAVLHGGPGAPGSMAPVARGLKDKFGVLEPLQSAASIEGQVRELRSQLMEYDALFILIGHSWGAWLAWMFAARYPELVRHIILVGSGPFDEKYTKDMMITRLNNLDVAERNRAKELLAKMNGSELSEEEFVSLGALMSKSDSYCQAQSLYDEAPLPLTPHIYDSVWPEAAQLRRSGKLLSMADDIKCKITIIHGTHDPHPYEGVRDVLKERGVDFDFILLDKCGHTPWKEKYAEEEFFAVIKRLL